MYSSYVDYTTTSIFLMSWCFLTNIIFLNLILGIFVESYNEIESEDSESLIIKENEGKQNLTKTKKLMESLYELKFHTTTTENSANIKLSDYFILKKLRKLSYKIINDKSFDIVMMIIIMLSLIKLIIDTYYDVDDELYALFSNWADIILTFLFGFECIFKIISYGFFMKKTSYLRDYWSVFDFSIFLFSVIDQSLTAVNFSYIKVVRLFRVLRVLRFISHYQKLKVLVTSIFKTISRLSSLLVVLFLI